jgi:predicted O-methyltransferase YrrM
MENLIRRAARAAWVMAGTLRRPPRYPPGHYYSALTSKADEDRAISWGASGADPAGVVIDREGMLDLVQVLAPMWPDLQLTGRYHRDVMYGLADAAIYHSMLRHFRPGKVVEVGSGFSTAVALDTIDAHDLSTRVTCVEPYPDRLRSLLSAGDDVTIHQKPVQEVDPEVFTSLVRGDFLFIDSTHVAKAGSDVVWNILHLLPQLKPGVIVHVHDIFWPLEYKPSWIRERRDWTEIYLVHAFLCNNAAWRVLLFSDLVWQENHDIVAAFAPDAVGERPGGLWLEKTA